MPEQAAAPRTLPQWLAWQQTLHPRSIELGLDRIRIVLGRLQLNLANVTILTIAGTNGKGTCAAAAEALLRAAGHSVGCYTSPHLLQYNERIRVNGVLASDAAIVDAFERIEAVRGDVSLSYFEFGTLAAFCLFEPLQYWVLEIGLGGRLDAVNVLDADVAVVTSIGLDHQDWLGNDVGQIAVEKVAVARRGRPLFMGEHIPAAGWQRAQEVGCAVARLGDEIKWSGSASVLSCEGLPWLHGVQLPAGLMASNVVLAALAVQALNALGDTDGARAALQNLHISGRCERFSHGSVDVILDVAHNREAVAHLAEFLSKLPESSGSTVIIFAALSDKPIEEMSKILDRHVDQWMLVPLQGDGRALTTEQLAARVITRQSVSAHTSVADALDAACRQASRVVVCGSFLTVAAAQAYCHG